jgi:Vps51/Vps67
MADAADDYVRRTERIKNLLSSYYGNSAGIGGANSQPGSPGARVEGVGVSGATAGDLPTASGALPLLTALDSADFDVSRHLAALTRGMGVERLLEEHRSMARDIKALDSDMQALVYENYDRFIMATDTIRDMRGRVDALEADMARLQTDMGERNTAHRVAAPHGSTDCDGVCDTLHSCTLRPPSHVCPGFFASPPSPCRVSCGHGVQTPWQPPAMWLPKS